MRSVTSRRKFLRGVLLVALMGGACGGAARAEPQQLEDVLERAAQRSMLFVEQFSSVKCTERVEQMRLDGRERVEAREDSTFDYLLLLETGGGDIRLEESRLRIEEKAARGRPQLLVTNGFSTLLLIFHPVYQPSFEFSLEAGESAAGASVVAVHFRQLPGTRSPAVLLLRGREFPLSVEGTAWVDRRTGDIQRIRAGLVSSMADIGLVNLLTDVEYRGITFQADPRPYWLPVSAVITVETPRQRWRNVHRFTDYKLFSVSTTSSIGQGP